MFKINKIILLVAFLFGVSFAGCVVMKKVADALVPDILLPDSILHDDEEKADSGGAVATTPAKQREVLTTKNYVEFIIVCLFVIVAAGLLRYFIRKKNQK